MDSLDALLLQLGAAVMGFFAGGLLLSRVVSWLQLMAERKPALAAVLHSGPWLLAGIAYWAYHVLSEPHATGWDWFFGAMAAAVPVLIVISAFIHRRGKRA